jgi:oxygen-independent coproporphyrinogen-3 oxidase
MSFGVYIHFPYCLARCPYCDFAIHARPRIPHREYLAAVRKELAARAPLFEKRELVSIYFGGGTPSLWEPECVAEVADAIRESFASDGKMLEVTLEANPEQLPRELLDRFRRAGINRLSLGVQSLDKRHLATLGRPHDATIVKRAVEDSRAAGFDNLSMDLIFAVPAQTLADLDRDLEGMFALAPDHLSIYNLTVEERTPFGALERSGRLKLPDAGLAAEMFDRVAERAAAAGFEHYEISSYARPGRRAVHNSLYWTGGEWLGLGCSAHSFRRLPAGGERFSTVRSVDDYLNRMGSIGSIGHFPDPLLAHHEPLSDETLAGEACWLALRMLTDGVDRARFAARFGDDPLARFSSHFRRLVDEGLVAVDDRRALLTPRGALFADEVGARFV